MFSWCIIFLFRMALYVKCLHCKPVSNHFCSRGWGRMGGGQGPSRGVVFRLRISPRIRSQNRNGSKCSVRDLCRTDLCKNPRKSASLPCPFRYADNVQQYFQRENNKGLTVHYVLELFLFLFLNKMLSLEWSDQKRFIYRLLTRHDFLPVWLVADK